MSSTAHSLTPTEKRATISIASLFALRMIGLFMIVPIFSLYAHTLHYATPFLIGVAMGCYGLTQALLQIPFGLWSDRVDRRSVIALGFILFALGSIVAALSHSIWGMIIGRSLQGAGAVGSATNALLADLTREEQRTKAMAVVGMTIGLSFFIAMMLGPILSNWLNLSAIFWLSTGFAVIGLWILYRAVPSSQNPPASLRSATPFTKGGEWFVLLREPKLLRLNFSILFLHAIFTASFIALPFALQNTAGLSEQHQWYVYLPALLFAFIVILPFIRPTEKKSKQQWIFLSSISLLIIAEFLWWSLQHSIWGIASGLWLFFTGFTLLEALIPSAVSKLAPPDKRGTALGINSCYQFLGIFAGGSLGGWLFAHLAINGVILACVALSILWLLTTAKLHVQSTV